MNRLERLLGRKPQHQNSPENNNPPKPAEQTNVGYPEYKGNIKDLKKISAIMIISKGQQSLCPLADIIAHSGIDDVLDICLKHQGDSRPDYITVTRGGRIDTNYSRLLLDADRDKPFLANNFEGITSLSLLTHHGDSSMRPTYITVGMQGLSVSREKKRTMGIV